MAGPQGLSVWEVTATLQNNPVQRGVYCAHSARADCSGHTPQSRFQADVGEGARGVCCLDSGWGMRTGAGAGELRSASAPFRGWGEKKKNQSLQLECKLALKKPHASLNIFKNAR